MMGCDMYFAYCGEDNFVPLKHYDPDQEDELLKKYCPEKSKEKKKRGGGGREGRKKGQGLSTDPASGQQPQPQKQPKSPAKKGSSKIPARGANPPAGKSPSRKSP